MPHCRRSPALVLTSSHRKKCKRTLLHAEVNIASGLLGADVLQETPHTRLSRRIPCPELALHPGQQRRRCQPQRLLSRAQHIVIAFGDMVCPADRQASKKKGCKERRQSSKSAGCNGGCWLGNDASGLLRPRQPHRAAMTLLSRRPASKNSVWLDCRATVSQDPLAAAPQNSCMQIV